MYSDDNWQHHHLEPYEAQAGNQDSESESEDFRFQSSDADDASDVGY